VFFAVLGLCGQILIYRALTERFPHPRLSLWWKLGLLFFPSLVFWSSGILKDTMGIFALGLSTWGISRLLLVPRLKDLLVLCVGVYLLIMFRPVVVPAFVASSLVWLLEFGSRGAARSRRGRTVFVSLIARGAVILVSIYFLGKLAAMDKRMSIDSVEVIAERLEDASSNYRGVDAGSTMEEGRRLDLSLSGILIGWPQTAVFTLFRPFPWEAHNILMLMAAFENSMLLVFTAITLVRFFRGFRHLAEASRYPIFLACLVFTLLFITAVGFSTPNLGSVSRYRIPMLPFFVGTLVILHFCYLKRRYPVVMMIAESGPPCRASSVGPEFMPPGLEPWGRDRHAVRGPGDSYC
jgi:hypothetical protein